MKPKTKTVLTILLLVVLFLYLGNVAYKRTFNPYAKVGTEITWDELQPGDIILLQERWIIGWIPGYWSHTVIFDSYDENGTAWIVESKYDGVKKKPIDVILKYKGREKIILRLKEATPEIQSKIIEGIDNQLGQDFSYVWWENNPGESDYVYCSELVWKAYRNIGYELDVNTEWTWPYLNGVAPQEIYDSPLLDKYYVDD